jgi:hypothetical protein
VGFRIDILFRGITTGHSNDGENCHIVGGKSKAWITIAGLLKFCEKI